MSKELPPSRTAEQFVVRFPEGMRDRITEAAKANNRSMNAEIISRLQASFHQAPESGVWEKTFPSAAQALRDGAVNTHIKHEIWLLKELHRSQLQARHDALEAQVMALESQALNLHHQIMQLDNEIERADELGEPKRVSTALKQVKVLRDHLIEVDERVTAARKFVKACRDEMDLQRLEDQG